MFKSTGEFVLRVTSSLVLKIICGVSGYGGVAECGSAQCDGISTHLATLYAPLFPHLIQLTLLCIIIVLPPSNTSPEVI